MREIAIAASILCDRLPSGTLAAVTLAGQGVIKATPISSGARPVFCTAARRASTAASSTGGCSGSRCSSRSGKRTRISRRIAGQAEEISGSGPLYFAINSTVDWEISSAAAPTSYTSSKPICSSPRMTRPVWSRCLNWANSTGAGRAILYRKRSSASIPSLMARLAWWGQMRMHSPQSMHRSPRMRALPSRTRMASVGQRLTQVMQPWHRSLFRVTE